ncbi:MAG: hypothetical protein AB8G77_03220 [Rhodothermales bacterium]
MHPFDTAPLFAGASLLCNLLAAIHFPQKMKRKKWLTKKVGGD